MLHKTLNLDACEVKLSGDNATFAGYASVFGGVDSYGDTIVKGAYESTLRKHGKPKMFVQHDAWSLPVGKWTSVKEDDHGLFVEGEFTPGMARADEVRAALKHGTVDGLSIGYYLNSGDFDETENGRVIRKVSKLVEVSIVTFPADGAARVDAASVKSALDEIDSIQEFERFLRDAGGFSREAAKTIICRAKNLLNLRDADEQDKAKQDADALALFLLRTRS